MKMPRAYSKSAGICLRSLFVFLYHVYYIETHFPLSPNFSLSLDVRLACSADVKCSYIQICRIVKRLAGGFYFMALLRILGVAILLMAFIHLITIWQSGVLHSFPRLNVARIKNVLPRGIPLISFLF